MIKESVEQLKACTASGGWDGAAEALSALCAEAKKLAAKREIDLQLADRTPVLLALMCEAPKARKNAARLLSAIGSAADAPSLIAALAREQTRFVVPSLLLALGTVGGAEASAALSAYVPPTPESPEEEKHCAEIVAAHTKALGRFDTTGSFAGSIGWIGAPTPCAVLLTHPDGFADVLLDELSALGLPARAAKGGVLVQAHDFKKVFRARCFYEALLPCHSDMAEGIELTPEAIAEAAKTGWEILCRADAAGAPELPYRIELRDYSGDRAALIHAVARTVGGRDNPSAYAWELRVVCRPNNRSEVFVKPTAMPDARFAYRKGVLPASIHPALAACIARAAYLRLPGRANPRVFDPCCGSGTLLIEAARVFRDATLLMGTDIAANAVRIARENAQAAHCRATFLQKDCLRFEAREPFDLIVANLPFGNRVGTHESNEALYRALVARLGTLLKPDGLAVLYTMEGRLLEKCLRKQPSIKLEGSVRTEAGGLTPRVYFCTRAGTTAQ